MGASHVETDEELLESARQAPEGDLHAFETLVQRHTEKVVANCRYITRRANDAEDLAQEVFLKAFFGMARFEGRSTVRTWLQRIKVNHCLNFIKKHGGKTFVDIDGLEGTEPEELSVEPQAESNVSKKDEERRISEILDSLPDTLRLPLVMCDMDQMPYQEIADNLGIGLSAVKMRIKRGREAFRRIHEAPAADGAAAPEATS